METKQPVWKCVGHIGDVDPIAYDGGFVYVDETNVYGPEMTYIVAGSDSDWETLGGKTPAMLYRIMLESSEPNTPEWWYSKLGSIAEFTGIPLMELETMAQSKDPLTLASVYAVLIAYFGPHEFDSYPSKLTEDEAYEKFSEEIKLARS